MRSRSCAWQSSRPTIARHMLRALRLTALVTLIAPAACAGEGESAPSEDGGADVADAADAGKHGCDAGLQLCGRSCTDTMTDDGNCGACGNACPNGLHCALGSCCPAPTILCAGACLDPREDDDNCGACGNVCGAGQHCAAGVCRESNIKHVVLIVQENHTFDAYFGRYCKADAYSNPSCTRGRDCCEAAPAKEPGGAAPLLLDDAENFRVDRDHAQACELQQLDGGKMDRFVTGSSGADTCYLVGPSCASANNWALADEATVGTYWRYADGNALADRYFQPIVGGTSSNNMYFAVAKYQFTNNDRIPNAIGSGCNDPKGRCLTGTRVGYVGRTTIADVLKAAGKTFAVYADGFGEAKATAPSCPGAPSYCPYSSCFTHPIACNACVYDASDIPFAYYEQLADTEQIRDYGDLAVALSSGKLPSFSFVKARSYHNEHPNVSLISDGADFVDRTIKMISSSPFASDTLILVTWDEGGGFFDHVAPPPSIDTDDAGKPVPYGTRVPLLAIGPFARKGAISHVVMEHSSIVRFLEYNFAGPTGQLKANDAKVNNLGSLLDPTTTGIRIPE